MPGHIQALRLCTTGPDRSPFPGRSSMLVSRSAYSQHAVFSAVDIGGGPIDYLGQLS